MPRRIKRKSVNNSTRRGKYRAAVNPYSLASVTSDREWENHKYIDKVKDKNGRVRYIYEDGIGSNRPTNQHAANVLASTLAESDRRRKKEKEDHIQYVSDLVQQMTLDKIKEAEERANDINMANMLGSIPGRVGNVLPVIYASGKRVLSAVSEGASYVSNALSGAIANTPINDLFK